MKQPEKSKANPWQWGDEKYAEKGLGRLALRLPLTTLTTLGRISKTLEVGQAELITELIEEKARSLKKVTKRP